MTLITGHPHITSESGILGGVPIIKGTRTPVRAIAEMWKFGAMLEDILIHLPHLGLAQIFDALSYYQDHRDEIDQDLLRNRIPAEAIDPRLR